MDASEDSGPNGTKGKTNERSPLKSDEYASENFDWNKWNNYDKEWRATFRMDMKEVRILYSMVSFYLNNYSGAPGRPPEEQHYLPFLKGELYKMIQDYNFTHHTTN